jgi:hypothetical protein
MAQSRGDQCEYPATRKIKKSWVCGRHISILKKRKALKLHPVGSLYWDGESWDRKDK